MSARSIGGQSGLRLLAAALTGAALLGSAAPVTVASGAGTAHAAAPPHGTDLVGTEKWGWVTVRKPSQTYTPSATNQGNSTAGTNTVAHTGVGSYEIGFPGIGVGGGMVHVSVLGTSPRTCIAAGWNPGGADEFVDVSCYTGAGHLVNATFVVSFLAAAHTKGEPGLAYFWDDSPTLTDHDPTAGYSYNSSGGTNHVHRTGLGTYAATLPGLSSFAGDVQVTAYGDVATCNLLGFGPVGSDMVADVVCRRPNGVPRDTDFDLTFMDGTGLKATGGTQVAYLFANQDTSPSYTPNFDYRYSSAGAIPAPHITRSGPGSYLVKLPGMPVGGAAIVTAILGPHRRCIVTSIRLDSTPQKVGVQCYDFAGARSDANFEVAYER